MTNLRISVVLTATLGLVAACQSTPLAPFAASRSSVAATRVSNESVHASVHAHDDPMKLTAAQRAAIAKVRNATKAYHRIALAKEAGYTSQYPAGCASSAAGGQGFHYLNPALVDATVELLKPELVMYEPQPDGSLQLVGVDYVVPFDKWTQAEPPSLLGMPFMRNEPLGVWALHIWAWRPNPSGMFAMWNPQVSCALASLSTELTFR